MGWCVYVGYIVSGVQGLGLRFLGLVGWVELVELGFCNRISI